MLRKMCHLLLKKSPLATQYYLSVCTQNLFSPNILLSKSAGWNRYLLHLVLCINSVFSFPFSFNFDDQFSQNFHRFVILCICVRIHQVKNWSFTILPYKNINKFKPRKNFSAQYVSILKTIISWTSPCVPPIEKTASNYPDGWQTIQVSKWNSKHTIKPTWHELVFVF